MPSPEEYRKRAKEARKQANACRNVYERQGLLIIADQCERIAAYKDLRAALQHRPRSNLKETAILLLPQTVDPTDSKFRICRAPSLRASIDSLYTVGLDSWA